MTTNDKAILITGCSTGIGYCTAMRLAQRGYRVFAAVRKEEDIPRLSSLGLESCRIDYTDSDSIRAGLEFVLENTQGRLYALFNNGAYGQPGALEDISLDALRIQFETNVFGWHELTRQVIPVMRKQGFGRIIQNSSVLGVVSMKYRGAYNASKYAIEGLSDTLRLELHGTGIYVSLVEPGPIESQFRANAYKQFQKYVSVEGSAHQAEYEQVIKRLQSEDSTTPFTLPPEAVVKKVIHALESRVPKARYPVTFPTYLFATLKRVLPTSWLDYCLIKGGA